ncbi:hypothetical protein J4440_03585 [Candidatus Woesearchaeota archaeon]|nr:hypothetical protein [Candidatus Woesearchaeota archaeon]
MVFESELKQAYLYLKNKELDKTILQYNKINNNFSKLNNKPEKLKNDLMLLHKEIEIYLRINEAYIMSNEGNLEFMNSELQLIHDLTYELKNDKYKMPLIEYGENKNFLLSVYANKINIKDFNKKHNTITELIDSNIDKAIYEFANLTILYHKLYKNLDREKKFEMYSKLKISYRNISIKKLFAMSRSFPKNLYGKKLEQRRFMVGHKEDKTEVINKNPKNPFDELHENIKNQDYSKAIEFYENL